MPGLLAECSPQPSQIPVDYRLQCVKEWCCRDRLYHIFAQFNILFKTTIINRALLMLFFTCEGALPTKNK